MPSNILPFDPPYDSNQYIQYTDINKYRLIICNEAHAGLAKTGTEIFDSLVLSVMEHADEASFNW